MTALPATHLHSPGQVTVSQWPTALKANETGQTKSDAQLIAHSFNLENNK